MMYRKKMIWGLLMLPLGLIAQEQTGSNQKEVTIKGQFKVAPKGKLYLVLNKEIDSTTVVDGAFKFTKVINSPTSAIIISDKDAVGSAALQKQQKSGAVDMLTFYMSPEETITINATDRIATAEVDGSVLNEEKRKYDDLIAKKDPNKTKEEKKTAYLNYIKQNPASPFSLRAIGDLYFGKYGFSKKELMGMMESLDKKLRTTKDWGFLTVQFKGSQESSLIGKIAPSFTLSDVQGTSISLSDYKGKYVLVDFWASWCGPCRHENPNLVKAYEKFHPMGLEVLGVSLDKDNGKWKEAIVKDGLKWGQVIDMSGNEAGKVANLYGVTGIPASFLVDPSGKIVAENLRGAALEAELSKIFK